MWSNDRDSFQIVGRRFPRRHEREFARGFVDVVDRELYAAKHQGKDRYVAIEPPQTRPDPTSTTVLPLRPGDAPYREASGS